MLVSMPLLLLAFTPTPTAALRPKMPNIFASKRAVQTCRQSVARLPVDRQSVKLLPQAGGTLVATPLTRRETPVVGTTWVSKAATALGWGLSGASIFIFSPIIFRLLTTGDAAGLSIVTWAMQVAGFLGALVVPIRKRYALSSYFDFVCLSAQGIAVLVLITLLQGLAPAPVVALSTLSVGAGFLAVVNFAPMWMLAAVQASASFVMIAALIPQIVKNFAHASGGGWSPASALMSTAGNLIRIFTTITLTRDRVLLTQFLSGFLLNGLLLITTLIFP